MDIDDSNNSSNVTFSIGDSSLRALNNKMDIIHPYSLDNSSNNNSDKSYNINMNEVDALLQYGLHNCMRIGTLSLLLLLSLLRIIMILLKILENTRYYLLKDLLLVQNKNKSLLKSFLKT